MVELKRNVLPPVAERRPHVDRRHGVEVEDPYHWLRDDARKDPAVLAHLEAENAYTEAVMEPTRALRSRLYDEMLARIKQTDETAAEPWGPFLYYSRTEEGKQYRIYCRRPAGPGGQEQILLDANLLAEGHDYFRLGYLEVSPDHRLAAFAVDNDGGETYTIQVKDLESGELLGERIPGAYYGLEWANDSRTFFYNTLDASHRPYRLLRHQLGSDPAADAVVFEEPDPAFFLGLYKTRSRRYLMLYLESNNTSEVHRLEADRPGSPFEVVQPRVAGMEYSVEHWRDRFYILTNDEAVNFKLVETPLDRPTGDNWKEVIAHRNDVKLEQIEVFSGHMAVVERENGLRGIRVITLPGWEQHRVEFPEPVYTVQPTRNPEFETRTLRFVYESLVTPRSVFDYDMATRRRELKKRQEVLGGYDPAAYGSERLLVEADDGKRVPVSLVFRRDARRDDGNPLLLYGYGSYGASVDPTFDSNRLCLLDRGVIFAIAHVRGGGDLGRPWYEDGKLLRKRNTFTDFVHCAERLIADGYTTPERLAIRGASAGGLLVGAVVNMRPELFRAAVAKVPFVDVINTMFDETIPLTVIEWEEWGDPRTREFYDYMRSYSPYDNVAEAASPDMLVTSGLNDPRVAYWEPTKWVARLRERQNGNRLVLLKTNMGAGHAGVSGRYAALEELAFEWAFILNRLGADG